MNIQTNKYAAVLIELNTTNKDTERAEIVKAVPGAAGVAETVGAYKGQENRSWLVLLKLNHEAEQIQRLIELARVYRQESILVVDEDRKASLVYMEDERQVDLGTLVAVDEKTAKMQDAWTYAPHNSTYYIAK